MAMHVNKLTVGSALAVVAAVTAFSSFGEETWPKLTGVAAHREEVNVQVAEIEELLKDFHTQWVCDEDIEELDVLLDVRSPTPQDEERIRRLRKRIDDNNCIKYEA